MILRSVNPYNNQLIAEFTEYTSEDLAGILQKASIAFTEWKKLSLEDRTKLLLMCGSLLTRQNDQLARIISVEMGKRIEESQAEIRKCAWVC